MLHIFKNKIFLLFFVTVLLVILMAVSAGRDSKVNTFGGAVRSVISPVQGFLSLSGQKIQGFFSFFTDTKDLQKENEKLRATIKQLERDNRELKKFRDENVRLTQLLEMKKRFDDFSPIGANVIATDMGNWYNVFTIDIGTNKGIAKNQVVMNEDGLVGKILEAGPFSSKVITIIDIESAVACKVKSGDTGILRGELSLKNRGWCRMDRFDNEADISAGDSVDTSGMASVFPKDIPVGTVIEVRKVNSEQSRYAIIKPAVDFKNLGEVIVLRENNRG